jgi:O-antigen/teichoic acid export membrane protein
MFMLFAQELVMLVAPPAYYEAIDVIVVVLLGIATNVFGMYVGVQYAYKKKVFWIFPITIIGALVNVAANITFIPRFGLIGAAWSMVASYFVMNALFVIVGQMIYRIKYEWAILATLFSYAAVCALAILYCRAASVGWQALYPLKLVLASGFMLIGWRSKVFTAAAVRKILSAVGGKKTAGA